MVRVSIPGIGFLNGHVLGEILLNEYFFLTGSHGETRVSDPGHVSDHHPGRYFTLPDVSLSQIVNS